MKNIILGFPTLQRYDLLVKAIASAESGLEVPMKYHIVDNGFSRKCDGYRGFRDYVKVSGLDVPWHKVELVEAPKNWGVSGSWNTMIKQYALKYDEDNLLIISNDDIEYHSDTIRMFLDAVEENEHNKDYVVYHCDRFQNSAFSLFSPAPHMVDTIGWFDEKFYPAYFEDSDYNYRIHLAAPYSVFNIEGCTFNHFQSGTFKSYNEKEMKRHHEQFEANRRYFVRKWGGEPTKEKFTTEFNR